MKIVEDSNIQHQSKLHILFVSSDKYPPFRVDSSELFGEEMTARGHIIDWVLQSEGSCDKSYQVIWNGNNVWVGKTDNGETRLSRVRKHMYCILHQFRLFSLLKHNEYDFIQVKNKYIIAIAAVIASKIYKTKFIYWLSYPHAEEALYKYKAGIARYPIFYFLKGHMLTFLLYRIIMPLADHIFVQSEKMRSDITLMGIPEGKMTPIPMGVSHKLFDQYLKFDRQKVNINKYDRKSIVYIGTIQSARRLDFLIRVMSYVLEQEPGAILYIVGDGDSKNDRIMLEDAARDLGISGSVVLTGFLPRNDALQYIATADVCVSPFCPSPILDSTSPTKLVEYMAMGKAVVANDHPEQRLVIEQSGGGICVPYKETAFANAIVSVLENKKEANAMGLRGRKYVEMNRDYKKIADFLETEYYKILAEG